MKIQLKYIAFFALMFLIKNTSFGLSNLAGGEITWKCVGKDSFMINLRLIRDCNAPALPNEMLKFYCGTTASLIGSLTITKPNPIDITPVCNYSCTRCQDSNCSFPYGFQEYSYKKLFVIPSTTCCEIKIRFEECCRTDLTGNISNGMPMFLESSLNRCISPCDNSPEFLGDNVIITCVGQDVKISQGIDNIDFSSGGIYDSVAFEWANLLSAPSTKISFLNSYDSNKSVYFWGFPNTTLPFPRGMHLDKNTGDASFRPMKVESSAMAIKVSEYRQGVKINEVNRNYIFISINCANNHAPTLLSSVYYKEVCAGSKVDFDISSNDLDPNDSLSLSWNHGISGATWTDDNGIAQHPTGHFSWVPGTNQASSVPHTFSVTIKDDFCPTSGYFTQNFQVLVKPIPRAVITVTDSFNGNYWFSARCLQGAGPAFSWQSDSFIFNPVSGPLSFHHFSRAGNYPYQMIISAQGCTATYMDTASVSITSKIDEAVEKSILIYPNPAKDLLTVEYSSAINNLLSISMYNESGQIVKTIHGINSRKCTFALNDLNPGVYKLIIEMKNHSFVTKTILIQ